MARTVLIDSGPIVAALRRRDQHHDWARAQFEATTEPFLTCEGVISESLFLLERAPGGRRLFAIFWHEELSSRIFHSSISLPKLFA